LIDAREPTGAKVSLVFIAIVAFGYSLPFDACLLIIGAALFSHSRWRDQVRRHRAGNAEVVVDGTIRPRGRLAALCHRALVLLFWLFGFTSPRSRAAHPDADGICEPAAAVGRRGDHGRRPRGRPVPAQCRTAQGVVGDWLIDNRAASCSISVNRCHLKQFLFDRGDGDRPLGHVLPRLGGPVAMAI
jgi:hypothetical protein